jgi:DNA-binding CsgD family transcriptional regulator
MLLLERDHLLAEMSRLADAAAAGDGVVVAVLGEAGVGKTSFLHEVAVSARDRMRVLVTGCEALFTPRPLGPFYDLADELTLDVGSPREKLFPAVLAAVSRVPTLLIVEDVHWADRATLDLLKYMARRISGRPVLLAISYRDDEVDSRHHLITLLGETAVRRFHVEPLSREAVAELVRGSTPASSPAPHSLHREDKGDLFAITGGNPFYVTEVLASGGDRMPATVRDAVLARAAALSPASRHVIELASLHPGQAELALIDADVAEIEAAAGSGIVRIQNGAIVFRHELGRRAIEDSLSDVRRIAMHGAILQKLEGVPSLARLAHHAVGARDADAVLRYSPPAAEEAARAGDHREAAAHYRNAVAYAGAIPDSARAALLESLAYECYLTEQFNEALQRLTEALGIWKAGGDRVREGENLRWQSRVHWFRGQNAEARTKAAEAIQVLEPLGVSPELAMAYSNQSQLHMNAQECDEAIRWGNKAIVMATTLGDDMILVHALNNVGSATMQLGGGPEGLTRSLQISLDRGFQEHAARAYANLGGELVRRGQYADARQTLDEGTAWCRDRDLDSYLLYMTAWSARLELETGHWDAAEAIAQAVLTHRDTSPLSRISALAALGRVKARQGSPDAQPILDQAHELAARTGEFQRIAPVATARAEAAWLRGDTEAIAREALPALEMSRDLHEPWARGDLALSMWRAAQAAQPDQRLRALDTEGIAEPYRLQIAGQWREAAAAFERAQRPYEAAIALADGNDPRSIDMLEQLGDGCLVQRLRSRMRIRGPRRSTRQNPGGLTAREVAIVELLDEGLRNADIALRLFVSAKTVDHHVSSILSKLGAKSRGEAARLFRDQK